MSIIRKIHNKENPYVQLNKKALWDERLSLKAVGLWARCMSRPDDWRFNISEMSENGREGKRAIYSAIDELILLSYAIRLEHWEKGSDGKFTTGGVEYVFFEFAASEEEKHQCVEEFKKRFRNCGFGKVHDGDSRNAPLLNNDCLLKNEVKEQQQEPVVVFSENKKKEEMLTRYGISPTVMRRLMKYSISQIQESLKAYDQWISKNGPPDDPNPAIYSFITNAHKANMNKNSLQQAQDKILADQIEKNYLECKKIENFYLKKMHKQFRFKVFSNYIEIKYPNSGVNVELKNSSCVKILKSLIDKNIGKYERI